MEQQQQRDAQATPEFGTISKKEFCDGITIKKDDRYDLIFFVLNTLLLFNITIASLIVVKSAKYRQCFMILCETSTKKDLTWSLYADIMADFMMS